MKVTPLRLAIVVAVIATLVGAAWFGQSMLCQTSPDPPSTPEPALAATPELPWFEEATTSAGITFLHFDPATPKHYIQETMGSGVAWIDYDADGWLDLFCVQDGPIRPGPGPAPTHKLYRNSRDGTFQDVTEQVGLARSGYGMGAAVGDYDNDGYDDLLITYLGGVALFHNEPGESSRRRFVDQTEPSGIRDPHWATSAAWGDIDGDGLLDLYICNYVEVDLDRYPDCSDSRTGEASSCPPSHFACVPHKLFRNTGNGTFVDITASSGVGAASPSPGLGVAIVDLDGDGKAEIYVANDMKPSFLFHNLGGGRFEERALLAGCGLGPDGTLIAGMGVAIADVEGTGRPSLFVTNFEKKPNVLFRNGGGLQFHDWSMRSGLGGPSMPRLAFGAEFFDANLDGRMDLAVANGHIHRAARKILGVPYEQEAQFFLGEGPGKFRDVSAQSGRYFREPRVGRGLAVADYDNDGKPDLVFSHVGGPVALLQNRTVTNNNWLSLELIGDGMKSNRNAIGARVEVEAGGLRQVRFVHGGGSYLSASDRRVLIGLGASTKVDRVTVNWPSGRKQELSGLQSGKAYRILEGKDSPEPR